MTEKTVEERMAELERKMDSLTKIVAEITKYQTGIQFAQGMYDAYKEAKKT